MATVTTRQKELETYLKCCEGFDGLAFMFSNTQFRWNATDQSQIKWISEQKTDNQLWEFIREPDNHKVDGNKWSNGFLGSCWADTTINGKAVRIAFYSKSLDSDTFKPTDKKYKIVVDIV